MKISDYVESQIKGLWGTDFDENGIPVIKTNNLTYEGHIDYSDICKRNITKEQAKECYLKPGDLLIEKSGGTKTHSVGYVSYFEGDENKFVCNNFILALRPKNTINSKFLFYQIQFKYESNQFSDCFNKTTGIQNLKVKDYLAKEIKIYSPEEQEKIVKELDTVRLIINKNKQILEKFDILIKSRFIEMFGDIIQNKKNWELKSFTEIAKSRLGKMLDSKKQTGKEKYPYLANFNVQWFRFNLENLNEMDFSEADRIEFALKDGDLLVCEGGEVGRCAVWHNQIENCFFQKAVHRVRLNMDLVHPDYMAYWFKFRSDFNSFDDIVGSKATIAHLTGEKLKLLKIPVPPLSLQNTFASFVQQIDKSKFEIANSLKRLYNKWMLS
ncbi:restriction endonuclease subunit S [uncultured Treponema sp.]|uniref:restriction endonuclease subunit S n=1 Tax=uncultured Treponema sp. TaxID=162155 RepID=UPI0026094CCC|nr:restriction endonuclease subunit S [uncultured Treponema sp.]